jgi:hypothetical protein
MDGSGFRLGGVLAGAFAGFGFAVRFGFELCVEDLERIAEYIVQSAVIPGIDHFISHAGETMEKK